MKIVALIGRILFSAIFLESAIGHFNEQTAAYAAGAGVPMSAILVPFSGILEFIGGISILFGYKAKWGAWFIVAFLVPVTLMMHDFWNMAGPQASINQIMFFKNLSMLGGALMIAYFGAGPLSVDDSRMVSSKAKSAMWTPPAHPNGVKKPQRVAESVF